MDVVTCPEDGDAVVVVVVVVVGDTLRPIGQT